MIAKQFDAAHGNGDIVLRKQRAAAHQQNQRHFLHGISRRKSALNPVRAQGHSLSSSNQSLAKRLELSLI